MTAIGDRVGAILKADPEEVHLLGYGVYKGDEIPPDGFGVPNPKIELDNGDIIWGHQCWWGEEDKVKASLGDRKIIDAKVEA